VVQVTENGTESDVVLTGLRTSTAIASLSVPLSDQVVTVTPVCRVFPPPPGKDSVFHPWSSSDPFFSTHRYCTSAGALPTVNVAVKAGACAVDGGQLPE
jgi:hypothetical protein